MSDQLSVGRYGSAERKKWCRQIMQEKQDHSNTKLAYCMSMSCLQLCACLSETWLLLWSVMCSDYKSGSCWKVFGRWSLKKFSGSATRFLFSHGSTGITEARSCVSSVWRLKMTLRSAAWHWANVNGRKLFRGISFLVKAMNGLLSFCSSVAFCILRASVCFRTCGELSLSLLISILIKFNELYWHDCKCNIAKAK